MASRLSYFLWSSMPDAELLRLAAEHKLRQPAVLEAQVRRMLRDEKSEALVENFAGQWLQFRNIDVVRPDRRAASRCSTRACATPCAARPSCSSRASSATTAAFSTCWTRTTASSTSAWRASMVFRALPAPNSAVST